MANVRKRISELTALTSASLDTTIVGVDGGTTYKIELDTLADAVTSRVNILDRDRLNSLESVTSSFETKGSNIVSSSTQIISLGFVSSSTLNSYTSSQSTLNTAFQIAIEGRLQTSSFNSFSSSINTRIIAATNEQSFNGLISGSSQLTSSYDTRYVLSGSITQTTWDNIASKPSGIVSSSAQVLGGSGVVSGSYETTGRNIVSGSSQLTSSLDTRYAASASYLTSLNGAISSSEQVLGGSGVLSGSASIPAGTVSGSSQLTSSYDARYLTIGGDGVISGSSQITGIVNLTNLSATSQVSASVFVGGFGVAESKYTVISTKPITFWPNITYEAVRFTTNGGVIIGKNGEVNDFGNKLDVSGSVRFIGNTTITGSLNVTNGLTGSIASTNGVISGSTQITTLGFATTSSLNTLTASFNSFTASAQSVTTGSNSFNGTQTITGSLIITTGSFVASQILANTASLYLTSGSNMYVQNNGVVEITGSLIVSGSTMFVSAGGDEGGEIQFGVPTTNTTLSTRVVADVWQNRFRIFDGNTKGVFVDLSKAPTGVGGELMHKTSGFVNTDVDVSLGNLKARIPASGNKSLQLSTISGTYSVYGSDVYSFNGIGGGTLSSPVSITTTPAYLNAGHNFTVAGSTDTWVIMDTSAGISWRITMIIGPSYLNNFISIERLH